MVAKQIAEVTREASDDQPPECAYVLTLLYRAGSQARIVLDF